MPHANVVRETEKSWRPEVTKLITSFNRVCRCTNVGFFV
jgi:hypothetical protein